MCDTKASVGARPWRMSRSARRRNARGFSPPGSSATYLVDLGERPRADRAAPRSPERGNYTSPGWNTKHPRQHASGSRCREAGRHGRCWSRGRCQRRCPRSSPRARLRRRFVLVAERPSGKDRGRPSALVRLRQHRQAPVAACLLQHGCRRADRRRPASARGQRRRTRADAWIAVLPNIRRSDAEGDVSEFATPFAVPGRGTHRVVAEFGDSRGWSPEPGSQHMLRVQAKVHPVDEWRDVGSFDWWAPSDAAMMGALATYRNAAVQDPGRPLGVG